MLLEVPKEFPSLSILVIEEPVVVMPSASSSNTATSKTYSCVAVAEGRLIIIELKSSLATLKIFLEALWPEAKGVYDRSGG